MNTNPSRYADRNKKRTPNPKKSSAMANTGPPQHRREKLRFNHLIISIPMLERHALRIT
jgi:hypothetical protein